MESQQKYVCPSCDLTTKNKNHLIKHCKSSDHVSSTSVNLAPFRKIEKASKLTELNITKGKDKKICGVCHIGMEGERALKSHQKLHITG